MPKTFGTPCIIKVMKFLSSAGNGIATGVFQKCNWGQIDPMVDRG